MVSGSAIAAVAAPFGRDLDAALERIERTVAQARAGGAGLVVFPECALGGYIREDPAGPDLPPALHLHGPEIARLVEIAGDTVLCVGYTEAAPEGRYSSAVCVNGDGVLGHQRKVHLPPAERFAYTPGEGFASFDTPMGRIGMLLCYDKLFPEAARLLAAEGAEIIVSMAAWPADRHHPAPTLEADRQTRHFDLVDQARAIESQVVWVSSNMTGDWGHLRFLGCAKVVDPDGHVRADTRHDEGVALAHVDPAGAVAASRAFIDHLADRRPAAYGPAAGAAALGAGAGG